MNKRQISNEDRKAISEKRIYLKGLYIRHQVDEEQMREIFMTQLLQRIKIPKFAISIYKTWYLRQRDLSPKFLKQIEEFIWNNDYTDSIVEDVFLDVCSQYRLLGKVILNDDKIFSQKDNPDPTQYRTAETYKQLGEDLKTLGKLIYGASHNEQKR